MLEAQGSAKSSPLRSRLQAHGPGTSVLLLILAAAGAVSAQRDTAPLAVPAEAFATSCGQAAKAAVERGVAHLHLQSCADARRAFDQAADVEPACALAHWGQAMSLACLPALAVLREARADAQQALNRGLAAGRMTPRERAYLEAAAALFEAPGGAVTLSLEPFASVMAALTRRAPEDPNPPVFQAWAALSRSTVPGDAAQREAASLLSARFGDAPTFGPAALALLMARDSPADAPAGRAAAEAFARVTSEVPHALHRPAHIFTRLGAWDAAIAVGERSLEAAGNAASPGLFHTVPRPCFAPEWLHHAYLQVGRFERARWVSDRIAYGVEYGGPDLATFAEQRQVRGRVGDLRARLAVAASDWNLRFQGAPGLASGERTLSSGPDEDLPASTTIELFTRGLGAAHAAWPGARAEAVAAAQQAAAALEARAAGPEKREAELYQALVQAAVAAAHEERDLMALWLAQAESRERQLVEAGDLVLPVVPAQELAGGLWLQVHRYADARDAFRAALHRFPGRGRSLLGLARALDRTGETAEARRAWEAFYTRWSLADPDRPEMAEARAALLKQP